ncbi:MAG: hypothetical protein M1834_006044 [Cirrosporium novae-zelandiae]|nr:MAG: hypothetical protein M1834_006044 [Cirrosporium novae-zelandiae]
MTKYLPNLVNSLSESPLPDLRRLNRHRIISECHIDSGTYFETLRQLFQILNRYEKKHTTTRPIQNHLSQTWTQQYMRSTWTHGPPTHLFLKNFICLCGIAATLATTSTSTSTHTHTNRLKTSLHDFLANHISSLALTLGMTSTLLILEALATTTSQNIQNLLESLIEVIPSQERDLLERTRGEIRLPFMERPGKCVVRCMEKIYGRKYRCRHEAGGEASCHHHHHGQQQQHFYIDNGHPRITHNNPFHNNHNHNHNRPIRTLAHYTSNTNSNYDYSHLPHYHHPRHPSSISIPSPYPHNHNPDSDSDWVYYDSDPDHDFNHLTSKKTYLSPTW